MENTSSAMISDCSSLLKRLERRPPARTLLMYSRKPFKEKDGDISKDFNLLFDVLVGEEESSAGACAKII